MACTALHRCRSFLLLPAAGRRGRQAGCLPIGRGEGAAHDDGQSDSRGEGEPRWLSPARNAGGIEWVKLVSRATGHCRLDVQ